jgi:hypothetical protein
MEAGTLPGNPPRRVFQVFDVLRMDGGLRTGAEFERCRQNWTGRAGDNSSSTAGRVVELFDFAEWFDRSSAVRPGRLLPPPETKWRPAGDPFAPLEPSAIRKSPELTVPELFGDVPVHDIGEAWAVAADVPRGRVQAWSRYGDKHFLRGTPDAMAAVQRSLGGSRPCSTRSALVEAAVDLVSPNGGAGISIWRGSVPARAGQRSKLQLSVPVRWDAEESPPPLADLELEANTEDRFGPDASGGHDFAWQLTAAFSLRPPFLEAPATLNETTATGGRSGVTLERTLARTAAGDRVVLTLRLRDIQVSTRPWREAPLHEWWWRRQLQRTGR